MLKRSGNSMDPKLVKVKASRVSTLRKRTSLVVVFAAQIGSCFPKLRKEFFTQRLLQIADAFGTASAGLGSHHSLDHLDVMRAPERKVFIMLEQRFRKLEFLVELFVMR